MVTSDFICPLNTLHVHGGERADIRGSVRVWDLAQRAITKTIVVGDPAKPAGTMEVQLIPRDQRCVRSRPEWPTTSSTCRHTARHIDRRVRLRCLFAPNASAMPQLLRMNREGTRLFVTLNGAGKVLMFNIAQARAAAG